MSINCVAFEYPSGAQRPRHDPISWNLKMWSVGRSLAHFFCLHVELLWHSMAKWHFHTWHCEVSRCKFVSLSGMSSVYPRRFGIEQRYRREENVIVAQFRFHVACTLRT